MIQALKLLQCLKALDIHLYQEGDKLRVRDSNQRLTHELRNQIRASKSVLLDLLTDKQNRSIETIYGLSSMQSGMLFHSQLAPGHGTYIEHSLFHIDDPSFEAARFITAIQTVVEHHDSLRAAFRSQPDSESVQVIYERALLPVTVLDWRALSVDEHQKHLSKLIEADRLTDFDLSTAPLIRLTLIERAQNGYDLLLAFHHILMDRWSLDLFWSEVLRAYAGQPLPKATPYQSYIHYLRQQPDDASFWRGYLNGFYAPTPLPSSITPTQAQDKTATITQRFTLEATQQLKTFSREQELTLNTLFQAAWAVLLARYARETDVVFGMVTSGRTAPIQGIESTLGLLINTLPFRAQLDAGLTGLALLHQVAHTQLDLQQREHTPLLAVQQWSDVPAGSSLFNSLFLFQNTPQTAVSTNGLNLHPGWVEPGATGYPLIALVAPGASGEAATLVLSYDTARYDAHMAERLLTHWQQLVKGIMFHPDQPVMELPMLTDAEYHQIVHAWNDTAVDLAGAQTIQSLFEEQVARTPDAIALIFEGQQLTYSELNAHANQLAHHLQCLGVGPEVLVGICVERSIEMVVGLLGILKAGGAYVPLDPAYPSERLAFMLRDADVAVLLTQTHLQIKLPPTNAQLVYLDRNGAAIDTQPNDNLHSQVCADNLAYVIYTSGSTGQPKGAMNTHSGLGNVLHYLQQTHKLTLADKTLQTTVFSFDVATSEIFWPLLNGACLVLTQPDGQRDSQYLVDLIQTHQITTLHLVPSLLQVLLEEAAITRCTSLKRAIVAGEALPIVLQERFCARLPYVALHNLYGPTETAIYVTAWSCRPQPDQKSIPIGRPVANTQIYLLDFQLQPVPIGVPGELHIGGIQVGRGYLNRPELTAEKFIVNPFGAGQLYKAGDLARWLPDGNLEYLGRIDHQVKLRGFRIELGEIEAMLAQHPAVQEAVVIVREDTPGEKRLVAYVVAAKMNDGDDVILADLRSHLQQTLPDYMVPSAFVMLKALPLTPNGKIDRKGLPVPDASTLASANDFVAPSTAIENTLASIWSTVLHLEQVGIHNNFFHLGGHSLLATQVTSRLNQVYMLHMPLRMLFERPTIAQLAPLVEEMIYTKLAELDEEETLHLVAQMRTNYA